ncbi:hypothetical protein BH23PLA1_BH23PLA1_17280 [soil metagenome]
MSGRPCYAPGTVHWRGSVGVSHYPKTPCPREAMDRRKIVRKARSPKKRPILLADWQRRYRESSAFSLFASGPPSSSLAPIMSTKEIVSKASRRGGTLSGFSRPRPPSRGCSPPAAFQGLNRRNSRDREGVREGITCEMVRPFPGLQGDRTTGRRRGTPTCPSGASLRSRGRAGMSAPLDGGGQSRPDRATRRRAARE